MPNALHFNFAVSYCVGMLNRNQLESPFGSLAQSVEQLTVNQLVTGSSPVGTAIGD